MASKLHGRKSTKKGTTHHGKMGFHGYKGSPIPAAAKKDPWKHVGQAKGA